MRFALVALVALAATPSLAAPPADFEGAWYVKTTERLGSCAGVKAGTVFDHVWVATAEGDSGAFFSVAVNGETSTPKLDGTFEKGRATLQGATAIESKGMHYAANVAWVSLEVKGRQFTGVRRFMTLEERMIDGKRVRVPCFIDLDVAGRRDK